MEGMRGNSKQSLVSQKVRVNLYCCFQWRNCIQNEKSKKSNHSLTSANFRPWLVFMQHVNVGSWSCDVNNSWFFFSGEQDAWETAQIRAIICISTAQLIGAKKSWIWRALARTKKIIGLGILLSPRMTPRALNGHWQCHIVVGFGRAINFYFADMIVYQMWSYNTFQWKVGCSKAYWNQRLPSNSLAQESKRAIFIYWNPTCC